MPEFRGIKMEMVDFDELIYNGLKTHSTYKETFNSLTDEQKDKYFIFLYWTSDVKEYLKNKDDEFILNYIKYYGHFLEKTTTFIVEKILLSLKDKKSLLTVIEYLPKSIISSYNFKQFLNSLDNDEDRMEFLEDGKVAFTGGINLADEYINKEIRFGHWKDSGVKITGDSVQSLTKSFLKIR